MTRGAPPAEDREPVLREIARRYWIAYATCQEGVTLSSIAADVAFPNWRENEQPWEDVKAWSRSYVNAFKKHKDRLLLEVSADGLPDLPRSASRASEIIAMLAELGLARRQGRK